MKSKKDEARFMELKQQQNQMRSLSAKNQNQATEFEDENQTLREQCGKFIFN